MCVSHSHVRSAHPWLLTQALYHCGALTDSDPPALLWRTDWAAGGDMLSTLCQELSGLAAELAHAPREHGAVRLLGEASAYLAGWHPPLNAVARSFAGSAARWAEELEADAAGKPPAVAGPVRAKQCLLRMIALLCLAGGGGGGGKLTAEDAEHMLGLAVQCHHGTIYGHGTALQAQLKELRVGVVLLPTVLLLLGEVIGAFHRPAAAAACGRRCLPLHSQASPPAAVQPSECCAALATNSPLPLLQVLCHWAMARRIDELVKLATAQPAMLTAALRLVLQRAPASLPWRQLLCGARRQHRAASFQAVGSDGHLYSINCLDGTVLEDGTPPGRLPSEILSHPLYKRSFGDWAFEVTLAAGGERRTISPVKGRFYEFFMAPEGALVVTEVEEASGHRLQLLDPGQQQQCGGWGAELPQRLRELHSHWLSRWVGAGLIG